MSTNSMDAMGGAAGVGAGAGDRAPRLRDGSAYAQWAPSMEVYLDSKGAEGVHLKELSKADWTKRAALVAKWKEENEQQAMLAALDEEDEEESESGDSAASSKSTTSTVREATVPSEKKKTARALITKTVERSVRVFAVLYTAMPAELAQQVAHLPRGWAYGLWKWLENKYQSTEDDNVDALLGEWSSLRQDDSETFDMYRARVNRVHTRLVSAKEQPTPRAYSYKLMDLNPRYAPILLALQASRVLEQHASTDWEEIARQINAHERRELRQSSENSGQGLAMSAAGSSRQRSRNWRSGGGSSSKQGDQRSGAGNAGQKRGPKVCWGCGKEGHQREDCSTNDWESGKPPKGSGYDSYKRAMSKRYAAAESTGEELAAAARARQQYDSEDDNEMDYGRLGYCAIVVQPKEEAPPSEKAMAADAQPSPALRRLIRPGEGAVSPRGVESRAAVAAAPPRGRARPEVRPKPKAVMGTNLDDALSTTSCGLDTMASVHMFCNKSHFSSLHAAPEIHIKVANGNVIKAVQCGTVTLRLTTATGGTVKIVLLNVYYNNQADVNLVSYGVLMNLGYSLASSKGKGTQLISPNGHVIPLSNRGRVMTLSTGITERAYSAMSAEPDAELVPAVSRLRRLHERLGHMGVDQLVRLMKSGMVRDCPTLTESELNHGREDTLINCIACKMGKARRANFGHDGLDRGGAPGEVLHMDTFHITLGKEAPRMQEYCVLVSDPFSGYKWAAAAQTKDKIAAKVIDIMQHARTQLGCSTKRLYMDGGTEFLNQTLKTECRERGIEMHWPPAGTQQLNGISERAGQTIKRMGISMLLHARLQMRFWFYAMSYAVLLWNKTHLSPSTGKTPMETMRGKKPSIKHAGVLGCDCYAHVPKENRRTLEPRAQAAVYLGQSFEQGCAIVFNLQTQKLQTTRDVTFNSGSFTHAAALRDGAGAVRDALAGSIAPTLVEDEEGEREVRAVAGGQRRVSIAESADSDIEMGDRAGKAGATSGSDDEEYEVERISEMRRRRGVEEYKVHWLNHAEATWEPARNLGDVKALDEFERRQAEADTDDEADVIQAHMAMSAMVGMQPAGQAVTGEDKTAVHKGVTAERYSTPVTYREAMSGPDRVHWLAACKKEIDACEKQKVWTVMKRSDLPAGANVLRNRWVFRTKLKSTGELDKRKARVTPKGYMQKQGVDYNEVYAHTPGYKSLRVVFALMAKYDYETTQMDVAEAFLHADLEENVYMELPDGYLQEGCVVKLEKSLYGTKQAPRNWDRLIHQFILELGWSAAVSDRSLYHRRSRTGRLVLLYRFVDDFLGAYHEADEAEFGETVKEMQQRFNIKLLPDSDMILGMVIRRDRVERTVTLTQGHYVQAALEKYGLAECRTAPTPEQQGAAQRDGDADPDEEEADRQRYMEITGTLMYAAHSARPDIAHAAHYLASHMQCPRARHMTAAHRVLRYLAGTKEIGLLFGAHNGGPRGDSRGHAPVQLDVCAYADADWANGKVDRKSITGWVAKLNGDPISWASKKQQTVALSTCEAELYAEAAAIQEVLWLRGLLRELGLAVRTGSVVHGDNQSTIAVSKNGVKGERTKHVDVKYHFVTETVESGEVRLQWVPTAEQHADIFTKALPEPAFIKLRNELMSAPEKRK